MTHLHATYTAVDGSAPACPTVCGLPCDSVDTAYRGLDPERVTCPICKAGLPTKAK